MEEQPKQAYQLEYNKFLSGYKRGNVSGEEVGEMIARLAQYYCEKNLILGVKEEHVNKIAAETISGHDEATGKAISGVKADIMVKATEEYRSFARTRRDIENIEQMINGLKYLQRSLINEFQHIAAT